MTSPALTLVIYDSDADISSKLVELLADWSACGWVGGFALISVAEVKHRGQAVGNAIAKVPASRHANQRSVSVADLLDHRQVRLLVVDPARQDAGWADDRNALLAVGSTLYEAIGNKLVGAIDLMVPWHGAAWPANLLKWAGWDTLVVAPEVSTAISEPGIPLHVDPADPRGVAGLAAHAAAFAASAAGLWTGVRGSPLDNTQKVDDLRLGRVFHRRMDASLVADRLRAAMFTLAAARQPEAEVSESTAVLERRKEGLRSLILLAPPPPAQPQPRKTTVSIAQAVAMFCKFMFGALLQSPRVLVAGLVHRAKATAARELTGAIFGGDSQLSIAVGGIRADGMPASLTEREQALDALRQTVTSAPGLEPAEGLPAAGQRAFWSATFDTALALASGAPQGATEALLDEGVPRYFPPTAIAAEIGQPWRPDGGLSLPDLPAEVHVNDCAAARHALAVLRAAADDPASPQQGPAERNAEGLAAALTSWNSCLFGRIGQMIDAGIVHFDQEIAQMLAALAGLDRADDSPAQEIAGKWSRFVRILTAVVLLVALVAVVVTFLQVLALPLLIVLPVLVFGWLSTLAVKFFGMQKRIFQLQYQAQVRDAEYERIKAALPAAVENAHRLGRLYAQYLCWSRVASAFLREPFGRGQSDDSDQAGMTGFVPKSVSCGVYQVRDERAAARAAMKIAHSMRYPVSALWFDFLREGLARLIEAKPAFARIQPEDLFGQSDTSADGVLRNWLDGCLQNGSAGPARLCDEVAGDLDAKQMERLMKGLAPSLLAELLAAHEVRQVGAGGLALPERLNLEDACAFHSCAFSRTGMRSRGIDNAASFHLSSDAVLDQDTRHWLDEVDTIFVQTPQLTFGDLTLLAATSAEGGEPAADESQAEQTFELADDGGM